MGTECPGCGTEYERLGGHWNHNPDHRPELTQHQKEVVTGLIMGDGSINRSGKNPYILCGMTSPNYLNRIDNLFGCLSNGVRMVKSASESAQQNRDNGCSPNAKEENYSDVYFWRSRSLPELQEYADWYSTGEKVWPEDIDLTPTVLKHWYCGDGHWSNGGTANYIRISICSEAENTDKIDSYFERANIPTPDNYSLYEHSDGYINCKAEWGADNSKELWDYMGEPLPDFEYKWPEEYC